MQISIHALREEGDEAAPRMEEAMAAVLSTPSARRATKDGTMTIMASKFLSTPSARRATQAAAPEAIQPKEFLSTPSARRATSRPRR